MNVELKPIKTRKIYEEIVEQIKQLIADGYLKPGDKLPSERDLVESFKVSRASIREALSALEMMGLLEIRTGEGTFIKQIKAESMVAPLAWALSLDKGSVLELLEVRKMIEVQAAGYAAERATEEELKQLNQTLSSMKNILNRSELVSEKEDHKFHYYITLATHNKITIKLMDTIADHLRHLMRTTRLKLYEGNYTPELLYQEHLRIYEAIKNRDVEEAKTQMLKHLTGVEQETLKIFSV